MILLGSQVHEDLVSADVLARLREGTLGLQRRLVGDEPEALGATLGPACVIVLVGLYRLAEVRRISRFGRSSRVRRVRRASKTRRASMTGRASRSSRARRARRVSTVCRASRVRRISTVRTGP
jgi:hypothetical protein